MAGAIYTGKKAVDVVAEVVKAWAIKNIGKKDGADIVIFGPDGQIAKVVEVTRSKAKTVTAKWRGRRVRLPSWIKPD